MHSPFEALKYVADLPNESPCTTLDCTWFYKPGDKSHYSSTNYILLGLVLLQYAPEGQNTWETCDPFTALGLDRKDYPTLKFPTEGPAS